ncbi:39S ribosomal protein L39 mitochondrial [Trichostrongylus colubriformis]|uniref:39S ribosomal protein L39 mitochondrial n=1 Tax=Trichostrongylus colubriformis TaxID=6319 RepID=A0AAN8FAE4_TRICO
MLRILQRVFRTQLRNAATASETALSPSSKVEITSEFFDEAQNRVSQHGRTIEKILITFKDRDGTKKEFLMNKNLSTPYDCTKHINLLLAKRAVLAIVSYPNKDILLESMSEPFLDECQFEVADFQTEQYAQAVNQTYWRSCSIILAAALKKGLKDDIVVSKLHAEVPQSFFAVDIENLRCQLSQDDLKDLAAFIRDDFINKGISFETVTLPSDVAADYGFDSSLRLCRLGDFVTTIDGPVISRSDQFGRFGIVKALEKDGFTRVGGVSLPAALKCSSFSWETIMDNARDKIT